MKTRTILIAGPTASGKSALALEIARRIDGTVVNADALQVYKGYQILTARPSREEMAGIPHKLYGHVPYRDSYSVGAWLRDITPIVNAQKPIVVVGGTGLYFQALTQGLVDIPATSDTVRLESENLLARHGMQALLDYLADHDPDILPRIDQNNPRRLARAYEVHRATGRPLSDWQNDTPPPLVDLAECTPLVMTPPRDWLRDRIARRFHMMMDGGAVEEVQTHMENWQDDLQANQALGAKEIAQYLRGEITRERAVATAITATHQYAKRQQSWFRGRMKNWYSIDPTGQDEFSKVLKLIS